MLKMGKKMNLDFVLSPNIKLIMPTY